MLVPLIGLEISQVDKVTIPKHNLHAYHFEEHKFDDAMWLKERVKNLSEDKLENNIIYYYLGPDPFSEESGWYKLIVDLTKKGFISLFCIVEAHTIQQSGRYFCPEFIKRRHPIAWWH